MSDISNTDNVIDSRDIIERIEELEELKQEFILNESETEDDSPSWEEISVANNKAEEKWNETDDGIELKNLTEFISDFCGYGGDEQWRGEWYPITLVRDSYWEEYCEELLEELGYIPKDFPSWVEIDMDKTADNMKQDYTSGDFDGVTFWGR